MVERPNIVVICGKNKRRSRLMSLYCDFIIYSQTMTYCYTFIKTYWAT